MVVDTDHDDPEFPKSMNPGLADKPQVCQFGHILHRRMLDTSSMTDLVGRMNYSPDYHSAVSFADIAESFVAGTVDDFVDCY